MARKKIYDEQIIQALLLNSTQKDTADSLGITPQTLSKRINRPEFKNKLALIRKQQIEIVNNRLVNASTQAVDNLVDLLNSDNEYSRYNASCKILNLAKDYISIEDILTRLEALEEDNTNDVYN